MLSIRTTFLWVLAAAAPVTSGHTWGEQLRNINDKGEYVGAYGYMRGYRVRGGPDFNEDALVQRMPASNENSKIFITADQLLCHENQRERKQASDKFPRLQTAPGNFVAIRYQENGHITTADTIVGKPEKGGTVYVYGTTDPKSDEKLVDVLQWTQDGKSGDSRGVLLAMNDYDDGRCYLNNETPIAQERKMADPAYIVGTPQSGPANSVMYCETDVKLPDTIEQGNPYTLYWVWQWPTLPGKNEGLPNGKDEYYSTCIDVDVASPNVAMAAQDASQLAKFAMLQQDAVSTAVSDWASRTALFSDLPSKREMGPVFSGLPNGGFTGRDTQTASLSMTSLATDLGIVSKTGTGEDTSVDTTTIGSRKISSELPVITETGQNLVSSFRYIVQSASSMNESSAVSLDVSHGAKPNPGDPMQTGVQPPATSTGVSMSTLKSTSISTSQSSTLGSGSGFNLIRTDSQLPSPTLGTLAAGLNASSSTVRASSTSQDIQVVSTTMTSLATDLGTVSKCGTGEDTSVDTTTISSRTISSQFSVNTETGQNIDCNTGDVAQSPSNGSRCSALRSGSSTVSLSMSRSAKPNLGESMQTAVQPPRTASAGVPMSTSTSTLISVSPSSNIGVGTQNETLELSPAAVGALRLAQFFKNLGAAALNISSWPSGSVYTSLADLLEEFLEQENTQHNVVREMLNRTGSPDVPACAYVLPSNASEMLLLVSTLKSIEVGAFLSLATSLAPDDTPAAIVLSSMATVAARQNGILRANTNENASTASFETLISGTLAYNLAQSYVQPGSCAIELPIHNLPALYLNNRVAVSVRPNASVTLKWDAAGKAAASRSGKELFVGWINQVEAPQYTRLKPFGDGVGTTDVPGLSGTVFAVLTAQPGLNLADLTDATLAGPVKATILQ